jgi:hypothetical protein
MPAIKVLASQCAGKTIKSILMSSCDEVWLFSFTDGTYAAMRPRNIYGDLAIVDDPYGVDGEFTDVELYDAGVYTQADLDGKRAASKLREEAELTRKQNSDFATYLMLKERFENGLLH